MPDPLNAGWRDYGARVGIWRLVEVFDRLGIRPSALLNSDVVDRYPQIVEAGRARDWAWVAHGRNNSRLHTGMTEDEERAELADIIATIERGTGRRPRGWLGPGLTETFRTPALLRELGLDYVLDWTADDQPFALEVPGMLSVPYTLDSTIWDCAASAARTSRRSSRTSSSSCTRRVGASWRSPCTRS